MKSTPHIIVRKEYFGPLIWSSEFAGYFLPDNEIRPQVEELILDPSKKLDLNLQKDLEAMGLKEGIRIIESNQKNRLHAPLEYYFDFTNICNLRCTHCYNKDHLGTTIMPEEQVTRIIDEMYDLGVMRLHLAGGEPTAQISGLNNYLKSAKKYGIVTSLATNGTLLNDTVCELLTQYESLAVSISLEGPDEESNSKIRGKGNFVRAVQGIKKLIEVRNKRKSKTEIFIKPTYSYNTPFEIMDQIVELGLAIGVDGVKFHNPERCKYHELGHYGKIRDGYYRTIFHARKLKEKYTGQIKITIPNNPLINCTTIGIPGSKGCIGAQELITINPDGRLTPCLMNDYDLGNYSDWGSIKRFWDNSEKLKKYLELIQTNKECEGCAIYNQCRGGCQVRKTVEKGMIEGKDPVCPVNLKTKTELKPLTHKQKFEHFQLVCVAHTL